MKTQMSFASISHWHLMMPVGLFAMMTVVVPVRAADLSGTNTAPLNLTEDSQVTSYRFYNQSTIKTQGFDLSFANNIIVNGSGSSNTGIINNQTGSVLTDSTVGNLNNGIDYGTGIITNEAGATLNNHQLKLVG